MAEQLAVFLDDGGVMNDNRRRGEQWQRLVAESLSPVLGGPEEAWAEANRVVVERFFAPGAWLSRLQAATDYASFDRKYLLDWLGGMCAIVGVPMPAEAEALELARRVTASIPRKVDAALPGAVDAIQALHARGYALHTASGSSSLDLEGYLERMGVRHCFGRLYGPDLIETFKSGPEFYQRLMADAGVAPADAVVVDDNPEVLQWAGRVGARTALVGTAAYPDGHGALGIKSLAELPPLLERLSQYLDRIEQV